VHFFTRAKAAMKECCLHIKHQGLQLPNKDTSQPDSECDVINDWTKLITVVESGMLSKTFGDNSGAKNTIPFDVKDPLALNRFSSSR